ncbi:Tll0287-like domain-containing protein [Aliiglaciecola aliphaticivorans]
MKKSLAKFVSTVKLSMMVSVSLFVTLASANPIETENKLPPTNSFESQQDKLQLQQIAKQKMAQFGNQLKTALLDAIASGGFENAVDVCQQQAPQIASELSTKGWKLSRTSLKTRNPLNLPNEWQKPVLLNFEQQAKNGQPIDKLVYSEIVNGQFRMMKAIPTGQLCIACHGSNVSPKLQDKIDQHYPQDAAINFSLNDIRGAFSVTASASN